MRVPDTISIMIDLLARAEGSDVSDSNMVLVVFAAMIVGAVGLFAAFPIVIARRRGLLRTDTLAAILVIWGLLTAASIVYAVNARMQYSKEYTMRIMQNYDATDQSDRPRNPWWIWASLAVAYGGITMWAASYKPATAQGFTLDPTPPPQNSPK